MAEKKTPAKKTVEKKPTEKATKTTTSKATTSKESANKTTVASTVAANVTTVKREDKTFEKKHCCGAGHCNKKAILAKILVLIVLVLFISGFCSLIKLKKEVKSLNTTVQEIHRWNILNVGGAQNYNSIKQLYQNPIFQEDMTMRIVQMEAAMNGEYDEDLFYNFDEEYDEEMFILE